MELLEKGEMKRDFSGLSGINCTAGSEESDEEVGSAPCTPVSPSMLPGFIDINSMVVPSDSFDESSLDFDMEVRCWHMLTYFILKVAAKCMVLLLIIQS